MNARDLALISVGGVVGACARYELSRTWPTAVGQFPTTTLLINVGGAFVLGFLLEWLTRHRSLEHWARFCIGVGVLGAFTTFSTFATDLVLLVDSGDGAIAVAYAITSVVGGLAAATAGLFAAGWRRLPIPEEGES